MTDPSKIMWAPPSNFGGGVIGWFLLAVTNPGVKDTYHAETQAGWIVLGQYNTEDDIYSEYDSSEEWNKFLQCELVRLALKKGFGSEAVLFIASEIMCLEAIKE